MESAPGLREKMVTVPFGLRFTSFLRAAVTSCFSHYVAVELWENPSKSQTTKVPTCKLRGKGLLITPDREDCLVRSNF